jgi:hypothetical protein
MKLKIAQRWRWIAKEEDDDVWMYTSKPVAREKTWCLEVDGAVCNAKPFDLPDLGPWRDSLHEILPDGTLKKHIERPDLKVDDRVLCKYFNKDEWVSRHFARWSDDGGIMCWYGGTTSWTGSPHDVQWWEVWKLPEDSQHIAKVAA